MTRELTPEAEAEREQFEHEYGDAGCTCFISPPCGWCTHPGNPHNQEEDETAWCDAPGPTADELIERNVAEAHRVMKEFISGLTAKHLWEVRRRKAPAGFFEHLRKGISRSTIEHDVSCISHFVSTRRAEEVELHVSMDEYMKRFEGDTKVVTIEYLGIPGD